MTRVNLHGKSRDEIAAVLKNRRAKELIEIIADLVAIEEHFTPEEIGRARRIGPRTIKAKIKAGEIRAHKPMTNGYRVPRSALAEWDERTALRRAGLPGQAR